MTQYPRVKDEDSGKATARSRANETQGGLHFSQRNRRRRQVAAIATATGATRMGMNGDRPSMLPSHLVNQIVSLSTHQQNVHPEQRDDLPFLIFSRSSGLVGFPLLDGML